jgi:hypothetical protein
MRIRSYSELCHLPTFEDRFDYLSLRGEVGHSTFGFDRWINQRFYRSSEWRHTRDQVIFRDGACDLGIPGYDIRAQLMVHHMNPVRIEDFGESWILDPEYLITTTHRTHNAIHYGDQSLITKAPVERQSGDTRLWRETRR